VEIPGGNCYHFSMNLSSKSIIASGAVLGAIAVMAGAFGANALNGKVSPEMLEVFKTGSQYQMYHALGLIGVGIVYHLWQNKLIRIAGWLFLIGILLFSGSLYLLVLLNTQWLGAITPLGGTAFIVGWVLLAIGVWRAE